jgi:hypothetical protein
MDEREPDVEGSSPTMELKLNSFASGRQFKYTGGFDRIK